VAPGLVAPGEEEVAQGPIRDREADRLLGALVELDRHADVLLGPGVAEIAQHRPEFQMSPREDRVVVGSKKGDGVLQQGRRVGGSALEPRDARELVQRAREVLGVLRPLEDGPGLVALEPRLLERSLARQDEAAREVRAAELGHEAELVVGVLGALKRCGGVVDPSGREVLACHVHVHLGDPRGLLNPRREAFELGRRRRRLLEQPGVQVGVHEAGVDARQRVGLWS